MDRRECRRRPTAAHLHLLPSGAGTRCAGRADAARDVRPHDRRDRARLPPARAHGGAAHRARQVENPRDTHPLSSDHAKRTAGAARRGAARDLPRIQRGLRGLVGHVGDASRSIGRGAPSRTLAGRIAARTGGHRTAGADAAPGFELSRAVAMAMRVGPEAGLTLIDAILARGDLADYHLVLAARADLCRRLHRTAEARASYLRALSLTQQAPAQG